MEITTGNIKISVWFNDIIAMDMDYFIDRFDKALVKGKVSEWQAFNIALGAYIILEYHSFDDAILYLKQDLKALQTVCNRNKKRMLPRSDKNERTIMNVTCTIGSLADRYIDDVHKHPERYAMP